VRNIILWALFLSIIACVVSLVVSIVRAKQKEKSDKARRFWPFL